jgi:hypothetical protein
MTMKIREILAFRESALTSDVADQEASEDEEPLSFSSSGGSGLTNALSLRSGAASIGRAAPAAVGAAEEIGAVAAAL